jgi:hypothetical protein
MQRSELQREELTGRGRGNTPIGRSDVLGIHGRVHNKSRPRRAAVFPRRETRGGCLSADQRGRPGRLLGFAVVAIALSVALAPPAARAQRDRSPIEDAVIVEILDRELYALLDSGGPLRLRLEKGERVLWSGVRGLVGLVLTNRRALAVSPGAPSWLEASRRLSERYDGDPLVSARVALVLSDQRVLAYDADALRWVEETIGPHERLAGARTAQAIAVVVTGRRALGLASGSGRFSEVSLQIGEQIESLSALADVGTLRTSRRVLVFRGGTGSWGGDTRPID